ncbi:MAG: hypothetical protein H6610_10110 [Ignavibacteriales bacterium]|nr:hypothetical protein [Ignavibacteriales bacterium]MCB9219796.1 hypothetical protein [Ignavibacteriales bacterium]
MKLNDEIKISLILFISFLIFYALQIPYYTSKPDVIVFAIRSLADKPITEFAYLPKTTLLSGEALPNYHLGHTIILWIVYQIMPFNIASTIWTSGFISSISGSLIVILTYFIWRNLNFSNRISITTSVIVGLVPSFWEQSVIGEVYALQYAFVMAFVLAYLKDKLILSSLFFMYANLVSPLSGLAFGLIFLKGYSKNNFKNAFIVGSTALLTYVVVYSIAGTNILDLLNGFDHAPENRGLTYRTIAFFGFILVNFNFFIFYLIKGIKLSFSELKNTLINLAVATSPQLLLILLGATFFIELGSFQLPVFWALAFPLGYYLSKVKINKYYFAISLIATVAFTYSLWIRTNIVVGKEREEAGKWLRVNGFNGISVIGPWSVGVSVIQGRDGSNLNALQNYYIEKSCPGNEDLTKTQKDKLIIASAKKLPFRVAISKINLSGLNLDHYNPFDKITNGNLEKLYENDSVSLFKWEK